MNVNAALKYLETLWTPEQGAFREAYGIDKWWQNDNYICSLVMKAYDPAKVAVQKAGILKDYIDTRWCLLIGDTTHFRQADEILPDWLRYADLIGLQDVYYNLTHTTGPNLMMGVLSKMYGLHHEGYIYDIATPFEGYTAYKLCIYALCALHHNMKPLADKIMQTVSKLQFTDGPQVGGIKTEYIPPEWADRYTNLLGLANCETTSLAIITQKALNSYSQGQWLMYGGAAGAAVLGIAGGIAASHHKGAKK